MKITISDLQFYYIYCNSLSNWNNAVNDKHYEIDFRSQNSLIKNKFMSLLIKRKRREREREREREINKYTVFNNKPRHLPYNI